MFWVILLNYYLLTERDFLFLQQSKKEIKKKRKKSTIIVDVLVRYISVKQLTESFSNLTPLIIA